MPRDSVGPLPRLLLRWTCSDGRLLPAWLLARDWPWLRDLLVEAAAFAGRPAQALRARWRGAAPDPRAGSGMATARRVLLSVLQAHAPRPELPARLRHLAFAARARGLERAAVWAHCARAAGVARTAVEAALFADLPGERPVVFARDLHAAHLALVANRALAQGLLLQADAARLLLCGGARAVLRTAWLGGAGLEVEAALEDGVRLRWCAGTTAAAARRRRALAALLPVLAWTRRWELRARCPRLERDAVLVLDQSDPLLPGPEPRPFDSRLEQRFAADCAVALPHWEVLREPVPRVVGRDLVFPDFELRERAGGRRAYVEIAGLRQPSALAGKLAALRAMPDLILCLPHRHVPVELRNHPRIVGFGRRVDVARVRAAIAAL